MRQGGAMRPSTADHPRRRTSAMTHHRVARGYRTQKLGAEWWAVRGHPGAHPPGGGQRGKDILGMPGHSCEMKARRGFSPLAAMKQAEHNAQPGDLPYVWLRMDGQGECPGEWLVLFRMKDIAPLLPGYQEPTE